MLRTASHKVTISANGEREGHADDVLRSMPSIQLLHCRLITLQPAEPSTHCGAALNRIAGPVLTPRSRSVVLIRIMATSITRRITRKTLREQDAASAASELVRAAPADIFHLHHRKLPSKKKLEKSMPDDTCAHARRRPPQYAPSSNLITHINMLASHQIISGSNAAIFRAHQNANNASALTQRILPLTSFVAATEDKHLQMMTPACTRTPAEAGLAFFPDKGLTVPALRQLTDEHLTMALQFYRAARLDLLNTRERKLEALINVLSSPAMN